MIVKDFSLEVTREIEIGINNFLKKSIKYTPFKLFYTLFKKSYPKLINEIRHYVAGDIENILTNYEDFHIDDLSNNDYDLSQKGELLLECYENLGKELFERHLTVKKAFNLISKPNFRHEFYNVFLEEVKITLYQNIN
tara:strand:- start:5246 stop:5659 length:414 start_codon:yes stop_codon:yes gene_type:complete